MSFKAGRVATLDLGSFGRYVTIRVEVKSRAAAEVAQRTIETCLNTGDAKPLLGDAAQLAHLEGSRRASAVIHGHGNI